MTKACFWKTVENGALVFHMQANGHADYVHSGPDIVCAACSMLVQSTMAALQEESLCMCEAWEIDAKAGRSYVKCVTKDALGAERAESMISVARVGFELLAAKYPKNVSVTGELPENE